MDETGTCVATPVDDLLRDALRAHQEGRLPEASALYRRILDEHADHVAALHLLGVVRLQQGDSAEAVKLIGQAAALRPDVAVIQANLAEALLAAGQARLAVERARAALRLGADEPMVRWVHGQALEADGAYGEAALQYVAAIKQKPDFAAAYNSLGHALVGLGRPEEAKAAYHHAIRLAPGLAAAHAGLGALLLDEGQHAHAHGLLERAVELEPNRAAAWDGLARLYERLERFDLAVPCRERVLALTAPEAAAPHVALARALRKDNRAAAAEPHLHRALALEPSSAEARFHLGVLHEERGEFDRAETCFRDAIASQPDYDLARARLATLLRDTINDADFGALLERVAQPGLEPEALVRLRFAQAQVLDARGDYARAAASARAANALSLSLARGDLAFRPEVLERFVDETVETYSRDFFARAAGAGLDMRMPVFVVGLPRSGTTLIEQILASHPRVKGLGELPLARQMVESLPSLLGSDDSPAVCAARLDPILLRSLAGTYFNQLRDLNADGADRLVDKMPENYKHLGLLCALFPGATFIHCRRDLRDVALSCWTTDFLGVHWSNDVAHIGAVFRAYRRLMDHWRAVLPAPIHELDYEETVDDLEGVARRLIAALGLEWGPACLDFHRARRTVRTGSLHQVRRPIYRTSVGRWRHYEHELADLFAALP